MGKQEEEHRKNGGEKSKNTRKENQDMTKDSDAKLHRTAQVSKKATHCQQAHQNGKKDKNEKTRNRK